MSSSNKITVNGSSSGHDSALQSQINAALISNGGVKRIQNTFQQALDEEGWSENLRKYVVELFRSGEVTTYPEAERRVYALINGGEGPYDLRVPDGVQERGVAVVKSELKAICEMENHEAVAVLTPCEHSSKYDYGYVGLAIAEWTCMGLISTNIYRTLAKELHQLHRRHDSAASDSTETADELDFSVFYEADDKALITLAPWYYTGDQVLPFQLLWESKDPGPPCISCLERKILCDRRKPSCARCTKLTRAYLDELKCHYPKVLGPAERQQFPTAQVSHDDNQPQSLPDFGLTWSATEPGVIQRDQPGERQGERQGASGKRKSPTGEQEHLRPELEQSEPVTPSGNRGKVRRVPPRTDEPRFHCGYQGCEKRYFRNAAKIRHMRNVHGWPH